MYHIATHNIGLGSYNDDFNRLMKDLLMKDHFVKGFYTYYILNAVLYLWCLLFKSTIPNWYITLIQDTLKGALDVASSM